MLHKLTCVVCGGTFYGCRKNILTCSEVCRRRRQTAIRKENLKLYAMQIGATHADCKPASKSNLEKLNSEAREKGMTYGKYIAEKYANKVKVEI